MLRLPILRLTLLVTMALICLFASDLGRTVARDQVPQSPIFDHSGQRLTFNAGVWRYLEYGFCRDDLCAPGDWEQWIILGDGSSWTLSQLNMVRNALFFTISALDDVGLNGQALLKGYRFRRAAGASASQEHNWLASANHETKIITVADRAFLLLSGFPIYHELGHVVDNRLGRRLSALMEENETMTTAEPSRLELWLREPAQVHSSEAAADAFALWVMAGYVGYSIPRGIMADADLIALYITFTQTVRGH